MELHKRWYMQAIHGQKSVTPENLYCCSQDPIIKYFFFCFYRGREEDTQLEIICKQCRSSRTRQRQMSMQVFLRPQTSLDDAEDNADSNNSSKAAGAPNSERECSVLICAQCRRSMEETRPTTTFKVFVTWFSPQRNQPASV